MSRPNAASQKSLVAQALRAEQSVASAGSQSQALGAAIEAAEHYMKALRLAVVPKDKQTLDAKCKEWLTRAEKIKETKNWQPTTATTTTTTATTGVEGLSTLARSLPLVSTRKLTTREEIILLESAKLNGFIFPPWTNAPKLDEFQQETFLDEPDLHLSSLQQDIFAGWQRPHELLSMSVDAPAPVISVAEKTDLVQDVLTDCSVVASLCATTSRLERGLEKNFIPVSYPQDEQGNPVKSASGKYVFRFYFNGCFRKVVIDDRLPASKSSRSLHVIDRKNPNFMWPAFVEKAYLKLRGGYDFPGSNSGTDLWVLTGWIPEQVFLHHEDETSDRIWKRLFPAFHHGDVLLTIGTGELTEREQKELGLVSGHDYAILDMREVKGRRQMLVKNPWAGENPENPENPDNPDNPTRGKASSKVRSNARRDTSVSPGTFWMECDRVLQHFENLYLNWNPGLFSYREDIHFTWDLANNRSIAGCFVRNPQFAISSEGGGTVWLLLGKHFKTSQRRSQDEEGPEELGFISLYVFKANGQRVYLSDGALRREPYFDSPNTLMRLEMPPNETYTAVVSEQSLPSSSQNFTLSAFSTSPVHIAHSKEKYAFVRKMLGSWTPSTAGGNAESARYPFNPQYSLQVPEPTDVSILLESTEPELATHVKLFWSDGKRISTVRSRDIITDSGDYRRGCAVADAKHLSKGQYTLVCSTFAPDQLGRFMLWISSTVPCEIRALAPEAAGQRAVLSDVGVLPPGKDRMLASLQIPRLTRIKLIARSRQSVIGKRQVGPSPVLMTVELGQGPYKEVLAVSEDGSYSDALAGVRIEDLDLQPGLEAKGGVWIVLERIGGSGGQVEDHLEVEALAEERVEIGEWIVED